MRQPTPGPWYYTSGAVWTTPEGPDDGGQCIATRASKAELPPTEKDANMHLCSFAPCMETLLREASDVISNCEAELGDPKSDIRRRIDALLAQLEET